MEVDFPEKKENKAKHTAEVEAQNKKLDKELLKKGVADPSSDRFAGDRAITCL
jgi:hypothetical protein